MSAPTVSGTRLGVIVGSSTTPEDFSAAGDRRALTVAGEKGESVRVDILDAGDFVLISRHGFGTPTPAHLVDHHANIRALCEAGCRSVIGFCSVGSLRRDWPVGTVVAPDDFIGFAVCPSFHTDGRGHMVPGLDSRWRRTVLGTWATANARPLIDGGVYAQTKGPRFETPAEIRVLAQHADLVGMTMIGECVLAQEAGLAYMSVCAVDNLANGIAGQHLAFEDYQTAVAQHRAAFVTEIDQLIRALG